MVIIGVIAAIAIPRFSRGSAGATDSAVEGSLTVLRTAIDVFAAEHGGKFPTTNDIAAQLTQYTDAWGDAQPAPDGTHIYGPYVRKIPPVPVGPRQGSTGIAMADGPGIGWIYVGATGKIRPNTGNVLDARGVLIRNY